MLKLSLEDGAVIDWYWSRAVSRTVGAEEGS